MRGGKSPLTRVTYDETLKNNLLGTNSGNLIFADSVFRTLYSKNTTIDVAGYSAKPKTKEQAEKINAEYDMFVLPFANAFRKDFIPLLDRFTKLINQVKIPVVVTGIGAQAAINSDLSELDFMKDSVTEFCKAVLQGSTSIGVRGEFTKRYLNSLGFADEEIDVIGCPSMFYHGPNLPEINKPGDLLDSDHISINISPNVQGQEEIFSHNAIRYKHMDYVTQNNESLDQILWLGHSMKEHQDVFPQQSDHKFFLENRVKIFIDVRTWIRHLKSKQFVFGTRIHGNIAGLLAGTPSFVLAHDSRTLELSQYFKIPHTILSKINDDPSARNFFEQADYGELQNVFPNRFNRWIEFLDKNGVNHVYRPEHDGGAQFDAELKAAELAEEIKTFQNQTTHQILTRLTERSFRDAKENSAQIKELTGRVKALEKENKKIKKESEQQKKQIVKYQQELEKRTFWYLLLYIKRKMSAGIRRITRN